jgi:hypothetical protein
LLHSNDMPLIRCAHKIVIGDVQHLPELPELRDNRVAILLLEYTLFRSDALDVLAMLVRAGEEEHVIPHQTVIARQNIGSDRCIGVTNVWDIVHVVDWRRDKELAHAPSFSPPNPCTPKQKPRPQGTRLCSWYHPPAPWPCGHGLCQCQTATLRPANGGHSGVAYWEIFSLR